MDKMLEFNDVELYYDHVYALKGVSIDLSKGGNGCIDRCQRRREIIDLACHHGAGEAPFGKRSF